MEFDNPFFRIAPESLNAINIHFLGRKSFMINPQMPVSTEHQRIIQLKSGKVSFLWRGYSDEDKEKIMTLNADEFIRRLLLHVLPDSFMKIRYYGLLAKRRFKNNIALGRQLLGSCKTETKDKDMLLTWQEHLLKISVIDVTKCPVCKKGNMVRIEVLHPFRCNGPPEKYGQECHA